MSIPEELARREERLKKIAKARSKIGRALCRGTAGTEEPDAARSHGTPLGHA
jgi:hypothetical protein